MEGVPLLERSNYFADDWLSSFFPASGYHLRPETTDSPARPSHASFALSLLRFRALTRWYARTTTKLEAIIHSDWLPQLFLSLFLCPVTRFSGDDHRLRPVMFLSEMASPQLFFLFAYCVLLQTLVTMVILVKDRKICLF